MARRSTSKPEGDEPARLYDLPLWATDAEQFPNEGIRGQGWRAGPKNISVPRFNDEGFYEHLLSMRKRYPRYAVNFIHDPSAEDQTRAAPQIYIEARSRIAAQRAFDLIRASLVIVDGAPTFFADDQIAIPQDLADLEDLAEHDLISAGLNTIARDNVILATRIAAKLSRRHSLQYSAYKLQLSLFTPQLITWIYILITIAMDSVLFVILIIMLKCLLRSR